MIFLALKQVDAEKEEKVESSKLEGTDTVKNQQQITSLKSKNNFLKMRNTFWII